MRAGVIAAALLVGACSSDATPAAGGRDAIRRDLEGYATAACLIKQQPAYLRDQGDGWAANIIGRGSVRLDVLKSVASAVDVEVAKGGMAQIMVESPPMTLKRLPVQYCAEIIDGPAVRQAIERAMAKPGKRG